MATLSKIGQVLLFDKLTATIGTFRANAGTKLMAVFLGPVDDDVKPDPEAMLIGMGWTRVLYYSAYVTYGESGSASALFAANDARLACASGRRFAKASAKTERIKSIRVLAVRIGSVNAEGVIEDMGQEIVNWDENQGMTFDMAVSEALKG